MSSHAVFQAADHFFCACFTIESCLRFFAYEDKRNCLHESWFIFDASVTLLTILDTWVINCVIALCTQDGDVNAFVDRGILRFIKLLRLVHIIRMARLVRVMPELMVIIKGVI